MLIFGTTKNSPPVTSYGVVGISYICAMLFSNEALKYVSYPTQALGKSCKMIPVMLFGFLIRGKVLSLSHPSLTLALSLSRSLSLSQRYSLIETFAVLLITGGINIFQQGKSGGSTSPYGLGLLFLSLVLDGVTGASQDKLQEKYRLASHELMFYMNFWAVLLLIVLALVTGQAAEGYHYCLENPQILSLFLTASITSAAGQNFIFYTISNFNALTLATITTTRKFFTILVSVIWFGHELNVRQWYGVGLVFSGLLIELVNKYLGKKKVKAVVVGETGEEKKKEK
jgi:solute carrier family 35 (UDP-galactose transporter), member B1